MNLLTRIQQGQNRGRRPQGQGRRRDGVKKVLSETLT